MFMVFRRLLVCLLWLWLPVSQAADSGWLRVADNQHASVRLRAQTESNGETRLLLDVALEKGWKTYWRSPGEGGIAPAIAWRTPLEVNWRWPTPQRFDVAGISTQGYHGDVSFPMTLRGKIPPTLSGVLTLSTCSNVCILTHYPFSLDMKAPAGEQFNYDFTRAMGTLPLRHALYRLTTTEEVAGDVGGQHAVNTLSAQALHRTLGKQDPGIVDQCRQRFAHAVNRLKHRHHLRFIADIRPQRRGFAARFNNGIDHFGGGVNVVMIINRDGIPFLRQQQRRRPAYAAARAANQSYRHTFPPKNKGAAAPLKV